MDRAPIPDEVARFILVTVPSVPYLEAMLLLRRETVQPWGAKQLAERIYVSESAAQALLSELHAAGVVATVDRDAPLYQYRPQTADLDRMIGRVAEAYAKNLVGVTHLIHSKTNKMVQQFADAFIWRKDS